eukprot:CAMPEP_0171816614 /NCGR_PEP_ID=MMETSP0992-20121227/608_2 /TAXON_ID=483369 /ORGANISM="non described non described, Strain CCMP2098" /LENGTH=115 /DNA_ID=CAMNT_0012430511 /DNA_START=628 /DNA_END=975 /DNA_ORIENTATION=-
MEKPALHSQRELNSAARVFKHSEGTKTTFYVFFHFHFVQRRVVPPPSLSSATTAHTSLTAIRLVVKGAREIRLYKRRFPIKDVTSHADDFADDTDAVIAVKTRGEKGRTRYSARL